MNKVTSGLLAFSAEALKRNICQKNVFFFTYNPLFLYGILQQNNAN